MIDLYYWPTPNGWKITVMLEECGLEYRVIPVNIGAGDQFKPEFLAISPNNRMPAIVDHDVGEHDPVSVFESGAILVYLAEKTGQFISDNALAKKETMEWVFWQMGNLGPMAGQYSHFYNYAPKEGNEYSLQRYTNEYNRCLGVLDRRLAEHEFIVDEYSIADMASWPWVLIAKSMEQPLDNFPNVDRWNRAIKERPAARRGVDVGKENRRQKPPSQKEREILFNQTAQSTDR
ncbi:MAG: glutathione S-transferase N-terminal domain-containing protein [Gammaproteobacteria bacterium]